MNKNKFERLGQFLRSRREAVRPEDVGLPSRSRMRTAGLRREDVAEASGVSLSWYTWLEQGRDVKLSDLLLHNIARALTLSVDERIYLFELAGHSRPISDDAPRLVVPPKVLGFISSLDMPAYVLNERWDRIGWNDAAIAILGDFAERSLLDRNMIWRAYQEGGSSCMAIDGRHSAQRLLAEFHAGTNRYSDQRWLQDFIDLMRDASPEFREDWGRRDIAQRHVRTNRLMHPVVGEMRFELLSFRPANDDELMLTLMEPADDGTTKERLQQAKRLLSRQRELAG
jgi:transcriptional regulator with XRE-family HTH domain